MCLYAAIWILCETKLICCCLPEKEKGGGRPQTGWRSFWTAPKWWMLIKLVKLLWWVFQANTKSRRNFPILRGWISPHFHESWSQMLPFEYTFHTQNFIFRIWHMVFWCRTEFQTGMRGVKDKLRASPHVKELNQKTIYEINLKYKVCSTDIKSQWSIMILYKRIWLTN